LVRLLFIPLIFFFIVVIVGCQNSQKTSEKSLFTLLDSSKTHIDFENKLTFHKNFNLFTYLNFADGGGVAIGDVNNDGLEDIFFTSNMGKNKLYLNEGGFKFKDITKKQE